MITSHPSAPEGEVLHLSSYDEKLFVPGSMVLCRNTAPLVGFAYSLLQRDIPCRILGRDIGAQLAGLVKKMRAQNLDDLGEKLRIWASRETERALVDGRSTERIIDQHECLHFFILGLDEDSRTIPSLLAKIDLMFGEERILMPNGEPSRIVLLSTIHRAKGLEFPTVFILDAAKLMPSRFAKLPWQKEQERNLQYVAVTRAQERLVYINSDCWKEGD